MLIELDDAQALDPRVVGAKAARLAAARRADLPALPGVVVTADAGRETIARAADALDPGGSGAARLAAMEVAVDDELVSELGDRVERFGTPLVARSSSPLEVSGAWAGAFSTFEGLGLEDLGTALRGVWASVFTVDALGRCEATGTDPASVELAVLVQPQVDPVCGGSASVNADGSVTVHAVEGSPRGLLGGWETGVRALVAADGSMDAQDAQTTVGTEPLRAAAKLAGRVFGALGDGLIEWAWDGSRVVLFQSSEAPVTRAADTVLPAGLDNPLSLRLARLSQRFPGTIGESLVLPWALSLPELPAVGPQPPATDPAATLAEAVAIAAELTKEAWQERPERAQQRARETFSVLRGPDPAAGFEVLATLRPVDLQRGTQLIGLLGGVAAALVAAGRIGTSERFWRSPWPVVQALAAGRNDAPMVPARLGPDRWEPFAFGAVRAHGRLFQGSGVVPGVAAGRLVVVRNPHNHPSLPDRSVIVAERPLPALSSLLWNASAMVLTAGNPAAHLMEVSAAIGVPTIVGVDLEAMGGLTGLASGDYIGAVDGEGGTVAFTAI